MTNKPRCFNSCAFMKYLECEHTRSELEILIKQLCPCEKKEPEPVPCPSIWMPHPAYQAQGTRFANTQSSVVQFDTVTYDSTTCWIEGISDRIQNVVSTENNTADRIQNVASSENDTGVFNAFKFLQASAWMVTYKINAAGFPKLNPTGTESLYPGIQAIINPVFDPSTGNIISGTPYSPSYSPQFQSVSIQDTFVIKIESPDTVIALAPINSDIEYAGTPVQTNIAFTQILMPYPYDEKFTLPPWMIEKGLA